MQARIEKHYKHDTAFLYQREVKRFDGNKSPPLFRSLSLSLSLSFCSVCYEIETFLAREY
jgi:hypothetical protein